MDWPQSIHHIAGKFRELKDEIERQERKDEELGPEPEGRAVLRAGWWRQELPAPSLPVGFVADRVADELPGPDEVRARQLLIAAVARW